MWTTIYTCEIQSGQPKTYKMSLVQSNVHDSLTQSDLQLKKYQPNHHRHTSRYCSFHLTNCKDLITTSRSAGNAVLRNKICNASKWHNLLFIISRRRWIYIQYKCNNFHCLVFKVTEALTVIVRSLISNQMIMMNNNNIFDRGFKKN